MLGKAYLVIWHDCTHFDDHSLDVDEAMGSTLIEMHTMGHYIGERSDFICIAQEYIPEQNRYRHCTWIPKANIVKKYRLKIN